MEDNKEKLENEEIVEENPISEEEVTDEASSEENVSEETQSETPEVEDEISMLKKNKEEIKKLTNENDTLIDRLLRLTAEYENYRKRTAKEKEALYTDACNDVLKEILPVVDNIERAYAAEGSVEDLKKGIEMTMKGLTGAFEKLGVEEIDASGEFDPNLHQAVMHVEDENYDKNVVAEVFMKGYKRGDKVIRHSVVKVAN